MKKSVLGVLLLSILALAGHVPMEQARTAASMTPGFSNRSILSSHILEHESTDDTVAYVFQFHPAGYVITSAHTELPVVIAWSLVNSCGEPGGEYCPMIDLVRFDLSQRVSNLAMLPDESRERNAEDWHSLSQTINTPSPLPEQWPPAGSTPTEGWLEENWTQGAPYNMYCPMDLIAGSRSVAGCPAVAMGSILNFLECTNGTRFNDDDDYYHNYHEYYWIDDDYVNHDFPSWEQLNLLMDTLETHFLSGQIDDSDKAAIVYASGAACKQVYTASISGTFGVDQAYDAYVRFGFTDCELITEPSDTLYSKMAQNMMDAMPIHLAIIDEVPQYGHNVVVDGYNTDDFFHINFGWGGSSNGWYRFPLTGMPYGMNIIEGVVLDIGEPHQSSEGAYSSSQSLTIEVSNPTSAILNAEYFLPGSGSTVCNTRIYSVDGRLIDHHQSLLNSGSVECSVSVNHLKPGTYILRVNTDLQEGSALFTVVR